MPAINGLEWTFDTVSSSYEKLRPDYPQELYDDLFRYQPLDSRSNVIEVGIGGGQATLPVLKTDCKLTAVEYGANFSELCRRKFAGFPAFSVVTSKFEDCQCKDNSFDLIYSASAFHWIPEEIGYPKVYRLLKSGGAFARFANHPYGDLKRTELFDAIQALYKIYMPSGKAPKPYSEEQASSRAEIAAKYGFTDISYRLYKRCRSFTAMEYTSLLGTYSDHIALDESVRRRFFAEVERVIDAYGGEFTLYDTIDLQLARKI